MTSRNNTSRSDNGLSKRVEVILDYLTPGATLSGDTFDENDNFILPNHSVFTHEVIQQLKNRGVNKVYYTPGGAEGEIEIFRESAQNIMDMLNDAMTRNVKPDIQQTRKFVGSLYHYVQDNKNRFLFLMKIKDYDDYTFTHSVNVGLLTMAMSSKHGMKEKEIQEIGMGAFLHDIGKLGISKAILNKKERLSDSEFEEIKRHPEIGTRYLHGKDSLTRLTLDTIYQHHEWYNGRGYPQGLQDEDIFIGAKLTSICDVYDALTTARPYKRAFSSREAVTTIIQESRTKFNPILVARFVRDMTPLLQKEPLMPPGSLVILSTGEVARVEEVHSAGDLKPVVLILTNGQREKIRRPFRVNLKMDGERNIRKIVSGSAS